MVAFAVRLTPAPHGHQLACVARADPDEHASDEALDLVGQSGAMEAAGI
jgi:hypothetical protein